MIQTLAFLPIIGSRFFLSAPNTVLSKSSSDGNGSKFIAYRGERMINGTLPFKALNRIFSPIKNYLDILCCL